MSDSNTSCSGVAYESSGVRVAVEGCGHGCLHSIYASVERAAALKGWDGVDLLIIGGDFQAVRNSKDMACMSVPNKYKEIGDFHEYYSGQRTAPYLTIFIGGNHEASNHLFELYYGGWVAPNIYYMGAANVLRFGPLRIAGLSGIWKGRDYRKPHFERLPYNDDDIKSIYHVRELDVRKLLQVRTQIDVGLSHDWPRQVEYCGDWQQLFSVKPLFRRDSENGTLGSRAAEYVLNRLRPAYWFSAHLHVKFAASVQHAPQEVDSSRQYGLDGASLTSMLGEEEEADRQTGYNQVEPQRNVHTVSDAHNPSTAEGPVQPMNENRPVHTAHDPEATETVSVQNRESLSAWNNFGQIAAKNEAAENSSFLAEQGKHDGSSTLNTQLHNVIWKKIDTDEDGLGRKLAGIERSGPREVKKQKVEHEPQPVKNSDEINLDLESDSDLDEEAASTKPSAKAATAIKSASGFQATAVPQGWSTTRYSEVSDDVRNQLPASFFTSQEPPPSTAVNTLPFPADITNKTTNFLALDKCLPKREFLQLLEMDPVYGQTDDVQPQRPFRLQYDKEWLAITRVFAEELRLGGNPDDRSPADKGEAVYRPLIQEEERWVEEHIVKPGKLDIPANFTPTAPFYDPEIPVSTEQQPPEYQNPQTAAFCELLEIENKFMLTEQELQERMNAGPRPCNTPSGSYRPRGGFRGRGGRGGRGRGGRGGGYGRGLGKGRER
ncbi:lariat debranching enzyme, C-terminal domain-containing protein [Aspergillus recurvatus]